MEVCGTFFEVSCDIVWQSSLKDTTIFLGKVIRDGLGQASGVGAKDAVDTIITNAVIIDYTGIYKADVGIKGGRIFGIGKAGNPDTMDHVDLVIGVTVGYMSYFLPF